MDSFNYFFSYSRQNTDFVVRLAKDLEASRISIWLDQIHISPGTRWDDSIQQALQASDGLLVVLSAASVQSQNVMDEVSYAIGLGKQVIPILIEPCEIPFRMARFQHVDFIDDYNQALQKLLLRLHSAGNSTADKLPTPGLENEQHKLHLTNAATVSSSSKIVPHTISAKTVFIIATVLLAGAVLTIKLLISSGQQVDTPVSTTVFVHGKGGRQDMILRQKGFVAMDVGAERKRASINENGEAFFQNLHIGDSIRLEIDFSEPYKTLYPDSIYTIQAGVSIYLPVALQGIDQVKGMVLYQDAPLNEVLVKLIGKNGSLLDTTIGTGDYSFHVPEAMQTQRYTVWFIKKGFKTVSAPAFPQTGEPLNIVMKKE